MPIAVLLSAIIKRNLLYINDCPYTCCKLVTGVAQSSDLLKSDKLSQQVQNAPI